MDKLIEDLTTFAENVKYQVPGNVAAALELQAVMLRDGVAAFKAEVDALRALVTPAPQPVNG